jgi:CRISPR-associated Csx2 family protein
MPTTVVSFLGTGQKITPEESRSGYRTTTYRFALPDGGQYEQTTSLFGTALVRFLQHQGVPIDRWIVLGTSASLWSELNQVLTNPNEVIEQYCQIDDSVIARSVDEAAVKSWEGILNSLAKPLELRLCLTGDAMAAESQQQIARALFDNIAFGNDVVFDISHGFRHQPVIATFLISLMRWTHCIQRVSFYSGVFEARQNDVTPVLELPICQRLVEASEAAAVLDSTGNFEPIARFLNQNAELAWFFENTNQLGNARTPAQQLRSVTVGHSDVVDKQLAARLHERLSWSVQERFAERFLHSARTALERGDYFRSVVLGYEALLIQAGQTIDPSADPLNYETRMKAENDLFSRLSGDDRDLIVDLQHTRNACAHGTRSDHATVQQILRSPQAFRELMQRTFNLYRRLSQILKLSEQGR